MKYNELSTYKGKGWLPRESDLRREIAEGRIWRSWSVNTEWDELKDVILFLPSPDVVEADDINSIQHIKPVNYKKLGEQLTNLKMMYKKLGINVHFIESDVDDKNYNLVYTSDLFFMTPEGAIVARMASMVRAGEEKYITKTLASLGIPIMMTVGGTGTFEGADAMWARSDLVLVGVGNRTNESGFHQVQTCLLQRGIGCIKIQLNPMVQHLMGLVRCVDAKTAVIRGELMSQEAKDLLKKLGFTLIHLKETQEVVFQQAMNFVIFCPKSIIMSRGNDSTKEILKEYGITILGETEVSELINGGGGIACASGVVNRRR